MAYRPNKLGRIAIKVQASGWGTAETSFAAANYVEAEVGIPVYFREGIRIDPLRSGFEEAEVLAGTKSAVEISLKFPLHGHSTATPSADVTEHPDALLMRLALGLAVQTGYVATNIASGSTTSSLKVTAANANWNGSALVVPSAGTPAYDCCFVTAVDTGPVPDTVTPLVAFTRTPSSSGTHYGSNTIYLANDTPTPITMDWIGVDAGHHIRYSDGLVKSIKVTGSARKGPMVDCTLRFTGSTTLPGSGGSLAAYTYGFPIIPPMVGANGARVYFNGAEATAAEAGFNVDCTLVDVDGWASPEGIAQQLVTDRKVTSTLLVPSTGTFTNELLAPGTEATKLQVFYAIQPGRTAGYLIPAPVLVAQSKFEDRGGLLAVSYEMAPHLFASDGTVGAGAGNKSTRFFFA